MWTLKPRNNQKRVEIEAVEVEKGGKPLDQNGDQER